MFLPSFSRAPFFFLPVRQRLPWEAPQGICREATMSSIRDAGFGDERTGGNSGPGGLGGGSNKATVTMRNLLAAATVSAARSGVTKEMIKGFDRFASGL